MADRPALLAHHGGGGCVLLLAVPDQASMTEREVQKAVVKALKNMGWYVTQFSIPRKAYEQLRGVPDLYVTHSGKKRQLWIEVKATGKSVKPGSDQERWIERTSASGATCLEVDSLNDLIEQLSRMKCL